MLLQANKQSLVTFCLIESVCFNLCPTQWWVGVGFNYPTNKNWCHKQHLKIGVQSERGKMITQKLIPLEMKLWLFFFFYFVELVSVHLPLISMAMAILPWLWFSEGQACVAKLILHKHLYARIFCCCCFWSFPCMP